MTTETELDAARKLAMDQLSPEERAALTEEVSDEEKAALAAVAGDEDDGGDDDDDEGDGDDVVAAAPAAKPAADTPAATAHEGDDADDAPAPFKPQFKVDLPADLDDQIAALAAKEAELAEQMKGGEIEVTDFLAKQKELGKEAAKLEGLRDRAADFEELNRQSAEQEWLWTVAQFKKTAKKNDGIDYAANPEQDTDLDTFVKAIAAKPENANKDFNWFLTEAHKRVKVLHGIGDKPGKPADPPQAKPRKAASAAGVPVTLAVVPGGDGPGDVGNDEFADLDKLDGLEYETALAKMTKEQRDRYLQAA